MAPIDNREDGDYRPDLLAYWANCPDCAAGGPWTPGPYPAEKPYRPNPPGTQRSVRLPDDLRAAWKASGLPLADLIRRGLGTGQPPAPAGHQADALATAAAIAPHHHPATTRQLDDLTTRLGQLASAVDDLSARLDAAETELELNAPGAWEDTQEAETAERIEHITIRGHAQLWAAHGATPVDCYTAAATWQMSRGGARDRLGHITARGLATMTPKGPGQRRDLYTMRAPEEDNGS